MAVENEILTRDVSDENDGVDLINGEKQDEKSEKGGAGNISPETVAVELELEKKNALGNNLAHAKGKQDLQNDSFEIQVEGEEAEGGGEDVPDAEVTQKQANTYAAKKTVAQGMMDIALITANANQLRYMLEFNSKSSTYYLNLFLISISLLLQVMVGVSLVFKGRMDLRGESKHKNAKRINNYVVVGIFLVTIINVFIASFTITGNGHA